MYTKQLYLVYKIFSQTFSIQSHQINRHAEWCLPVTVVDCSVVLVVKGSEVDTRVDKPGYR